MPPGEQEDGDGNRRRVVQARAQRVVLGGQLDPGDVAKPGELAFAAGLDDDLAELLLVEQTALGVDVSWNGTCSGIGGPPRIPAETWTFCCWIACTTSPAVRFRAATLAGSSQIRMA